MKRPVILLFFVFLFVSCSQRNKTTGKATYEGKDMTGLASIIRNKETKKTTLVINVAGKWVLYAGNSVDEIDYSKPLAGAFEAGRYPLDVSDSSRIYFQLVTDKSRVILADKRLPMEGGYNFRDIGGIRNKEGKYVKWGKIFRADGLSGLTTADLNYLSSIPIVSIVDFRTETEVEKAPDKLPESVKKVYSLSITPGNLNASVKMNDSLSLLNEEKSADLMSEMYELLVTDPACIKQYKEFFRLIQREKNLPLLFHCSAGKDRTGVAAALFLNALGVEEDTILEDYLLSNLYLGDKYSDIINKKPYLKPLFEVKPEYLSIGMERIRKEYGSLDNYLKTVLDVDIDKLKEMYLY